MWLLPDIPCFQEIYFVRVSFEIGDERGAPRPAPEADHLAAYKPFLYPSKEAALEALVQERGKKVKALSKTLFVIPETPLTSRLFTVQ